MKLKLASFICILLFIHCTNPIEKKRRELQNCKITVESLKVKNFRMFLIPPVPKIYFTANIQIENTNEVPVTIEKFSFKVSTVEGGNENTYLAEVENKSEYTIPALTTEIIQADMQTLFEENVNKKLMIFFADLMKAALGGGEMEFILEGTIEFNTVLGKMNIPLKEKVKTSLRNPKKTEKKP
ncbi:MAG: hypothetical protein KBA66_14375 [Leptospiraceae bacterium]|nr:hypothetical protein [Leptospiraceae bacterium]